MYFSPRMFDLEEAIRVRHSTRMFLPRQLVPRALVDEALALAQLAPSNSNIQPWRMVFATGPARARLVEGATRGRPPWATEHPSPARVVPALPPRTRRGSLRVDGNRSRG